MGWATALGKELVSIVKACGFWLPGGFGVLASELLSVPRIIGEHLAVCNTSPFLKPYISVWKRQ